MPMAAMLGPTVRITPRAEAQIQGSILLLRFGFLPLLSYKIR